MPVVALIGGGSADAYERETIAFRKGLDETGYIEAKNVTVEYHWLEGRYERLTALMTDLVRRRVTVIASPGSNVATLAAKAATATIPIVFGVGDDPVKLGLVESFARPSGNATGINFVAQITAKRLRLLHDLLPKALRIAVLVNPANATPAEAAIREVQETAPIMGLQVQTIPEAKTSTEIDAAFAALTHERPDAIFVAPDGFFGSRRGQFATLAAVNKLPAAYWNRGFVAVGGFMSYGTDIADMFHQVGVYTGRILNGAKPAELPVPQSTKFEFAINLQTARALGIEVPSGLLSIADEVIE
jgi:putative ABC transport system substrate-binding protein